jgi:hypothetical protein
LAKDLGIVGSIQAYLADMQRFPSLRSKQGGHSRGESLIK